MHPKAIAAASDSEMCQRVSACCDSATGTPTDQQLFLVPVVNILRAPVCVLLPVSALPAVTVPAGTLLSSLHSRGEEFASALQAWFYTGRLFSPCHHVKAEQGVAACWDALCLGCALWVLLWPGPRADQDPTVLLATLCPLKNKKTKF